MPRVFLITGTSTGFGKCLVEQVLSRGDIAIATARDPSKLSFNGTTKDNYLALALDVTDRSSIAAAFAAAQKAFPRIDVVVNNAGYGLGGEFESLSEPEIRTQMEVNFFGLIDVTRAALQAMRTQSPPGGVIQQVTSIGGLMGFPGFSVYCASKHAVEGFSEAVQKELKPEWGIRLTCIEPGGFRTDWAGRSMLFAAGKEPAYDHMDAKALMTKRNGTQAGDPPKAAKVMYELAVMKDPPIRCLIGTDAYKAFSGKLDMTAESLKKFAEWSNSTDVDGYQAPQ